MYTVPADDDANGPWPIFKRILGYPEMAELGDMLKSDLTVAFLMRSGEWREGGRGLLGMCCMPTVNGRLRTLFDHMLENWLGYYPDFLIILNADFWEQATATMREALVFHEAKHAGQAKDAFGAPRFHRETGAPIPCIVPHDLEEFADVVTRYGAWSPDIQKFLDAAEGPLAGHSGAPDSLAAFEVSVGATARDRVPAASGDRHG